MPWILLDFAMTMRLVTLLELLSRLILFTLFNLMHFNEEFWIRLNPWQWSHYAFSLFTLHYELLSAVFIVFTFYAHWSYPYTTTLRIEGSFSLGLWFSITSLEALIFVIRCWCFDLELITCYFMELYQIWEKFLGFKYLIVVDPPVV